MSESSLAKESPGKIESGELMGTAAKYKPNVEIANDAESVARRSIDLFVADAEKAINEKNVFRVAISGGQTPRRFFELLAESPQGQSLQWDKIQLFWVDERYVPPDSEWSNYNLAAKTFIDNNWMDLSVKTGASFMPSRAKGRDTFVKAGGEILHLSPAEMEKVEKLFAPIWDEFIADREAKGFPAKKAVDELYQILETNQMVSEKSYE